MQPRVMNHCRIPGENRRLYRWMARIRKTPTERDLNDVFEVELNFIGYQRIGEPVERSVQFFFELFEDGYDPFDSRLIDHTARSIDQETNVFMKLNIGREVHCCLIADVPPFDSLASSLVANDLVARLCGDTTSHCAAYPRSCNIHTV